MTKLSEKQKQKLRGYSGEDDYGPYSEVHLITETRILDDYVSRTTMFVVANINPLTFETIEKNVDKFDPEDNIKDLLNNAEYIGDSYGYVVGFSPAFGVDPHDARTMRRARKALEPYRKEAEELIIKLHAFVMRLLGIKREVFDIVPKIGE